jgi:LuxR family transcriptional regulator
MNSTDKYPKNINQIDRGPFRALNKPKVFFEEIEKHSTRGIFVAVNASLRSKGSIYTSFHPDWFMEYDQGGYPVFDPLVHWAFKTGGGLRWSEVLQKRDIVDQLIESLMPERHVDVMKLAETKFQMKFGGIFARRNKLSLTLISVCRDDRELTDNEMLQIQTKFDWMYHKVCSKSGLTPREINTLQSLKNGLEIADIAKKELKSRDTITKRIASAKTKLGATSTIETVVLAMDHGYI